MGVERGLLNTLKFLPGRRRNTNPAIRLSDSEVIMMTPGVAAWTICEDDKRTAKVGNVARFRLVFTMVSRFARIP
jgi:hypothetical protein